MSQEKVNRYKEQKANRKEELAKAKRKSLIAKVVAGVIVLALIGWIGYSVYDSATEPAAVEVDVTALDEYMSSLEEE